MFEKADYLISNFFTQCDEFIDKLKENEANNECNNS